MVSEIIKKKKISRLGTSLILCTVLYITSYSCCRVEGRLNVNRSTTLIETSKTHEQDTSKDHRHRRYLRTFSDFSATIVHTQQRERDSRHRTLSETFFDTPMKDWDATEWGFAAAVLFFLCVSFCCCVLPYCCLCLLPVTSALQDFLCLCCLWELCCAP